MHEDSDKLHLVDVESFSDVSIKLHDEMHMAEIIAINVTDAFLCALCIITPPLLTK